MFDLAISHPVLTEYEEVIARLAARYPLKRPTDWLSAIKQAGHLFVPAPLPAAARRHRRPGRREVHRMCRGSAGPLPRHGRQGPSADFEKSRRRLDCRRHGFPADALPENPA